MFQDGVNANAAVGFGVNSNVLWWGQKLEDADAKTMRSSFLK